VHEQGLKHVQCRKRTAGQPLCNHVTEQGPEPPLEADVVKGRRRQDGKMEQWPLFSYVCRYDDERKVWHQFRPENVDQLGAMAPRE